MCVFCGKPGGSEEHIISTSVQRRMRITEVEIESGIRDAEDYGQFRKSHRFEKLVTREVCDECNRGWMSQLEIDFLAVAGKLIQPDWPEVDAAFIRECVKGSTTIGRWAIKTAITASLAGVLHYRIPPEIAVGVRLGKLPETFALKLAHIRERSFNLLINPGFKFLGENGEEWKVSESGKAFDAVFQLNHLAIRAINAPRATVGFEAPDRILPISAFPVAGDVSLSEYSFASFDDFECRLLVRPVKRQPPDCTR
jgi:hypothetical protein